MRLLIIVNKELQQFAMFGRAKIRVSKVWNVECW